MTTTAYPLAKDDVRPEAEPTVVLLVGLSDVDAAELARELGVEVRVTGGVEEAHELLADRQVAVLCLGPEVAGDRARTFLDDVAERHPGYRGCTVVLAAGPALDVFRDLVSADRVYYLTQKPPPAADLFHILRSGVERYRDRGSGRDEADEDEQALATHRVLELTERIARQTDLALAVNRTAAAVGDLVAADRAAVLLYDAETDTLWNREPGEEEERRESAAAGLVSYVVRTRAPVRLDRVGDDPRYEPEADNDEGPPDERFLAAPVLGDDHVRAVLVALRDAASPPFTEGDQDQLLLLARHVAPVLDRLLLQRELEEKAARRHGAFAGEAGRIFRDEALEHHVRGLHDQGQVLQIAPGWTAWAYRVLLLLFVAALAFSLVGSVHEYASGPAVVRFEGQTDVTAPMTGTVVAVEVAAGQRVAAGDLLVRLYGAQEAADLERVRREFEIALVSRLRAPADPTSERILGTLRAEKVWTERRLEERSVRAPYDGVVGDVWVQPGQNLSPGQVILSLDTGDPSLGIVALLPGHYRPRLRPGMPLRLELQGYSYAYQHLTVETIGDEVVGPAEAQRFLGPGIGDAVPLDGPVVYVTARLPSSTFEADGRAYAYHGGTLGTAEVRVRSEKILFALVPGLKALWGGHE